MKITLFFRKPFKNQYSIENVFNAILPTLLVNYNIQVKQFSYSSQGLSNRLKILQEAFSVRSDVYHITGDINFALLGLIGRKTVLTIHDLIFYNRSEGIKKMILGIFWIKIPCFLASRITTVSEETKNELIKVMPSIEHKISVIYNPLTVDQNEVTLVSNDKPLIDGKYLLLIGTKDNKNIERQLIAASEAGSISQVVIIGSRSKKLDSLYENFSLSIISKDNLSLRDLYNTYLHAEILLFCSTSEGFGLPILEANNCGCPVLTSNCSSMPEVGGDAALYVDPYKVSEIREAIVQLIKDDELRADLINKGFENVKRFDPEVIAAQYDALYQDILAKK